MSRKKLRRNRILGITQVGRSVDPLIGIWLRDRILGIDSYNPIPIANEREMLEYISKQKCDCGGRFVVEEFFDICISGWTAPKLVRVKCRKCGKSKNLVFAYKYVTMV